MDEIEYKFNTNNSVLVVNAVDKLISLIKSKFKPAERQRFVLENEELKTLRSKCSAREQVVSLTACQGLLALVELGVLEIGHTMSTVVTMLPSAHNYSAIISTMAGLLILDLKSRLVPGQPYQCQFALKSPQHPFITVLEKNKDAEDDVLTQMEALCTHPDYVVSSNSLELLRPVFLWLTCNPRHSCGARPWRLLLSLPPSEPQRTLLLSCLSCQQICNPELIPRALAAYSAVADTAVHSRDAARVAALLPALARVSTELLRHGHDPRACYSLMERCVSLDAAARGAGLTLALLSDNLPLTSAAHLHELLNLALNITTKFKCSSVNLNTFVASSLQWLHTPSYLTTNALKVSSKLVDIYQSEEPEYRLDMPNLLANKIFETLLYTDVRLSVVFKLNETWEKVRDDPDRLGRWLEVIEKADGIMKLELVGFLIGIAMERRKEEWFGEMAIRALRIVVGAVELKKELAVTLLPVLMYKLANDPAPLMRLECLRALPLMAKTKENVHTIVSVLGKLRAGRGVPASLLIELYTSLAETQVRCFPYLLELLAEESPARPDDLRWEQQVARAAAVERICEIRPSSHGLELVPTISWILNRCNDRAGAAPTSLALAALGHLWRGAAVAPAGTWRALHAKIGADARPTVQISICQLLSAIPSLRVSTPEYDELLASAARRLWAYVADAEPYVAMEACRALAHYRLDDYTLKDIPQIYRNTVKLPPSYCKTPVDAARNPEDVLDYIPCEVWPEVFKNTNQDALEGVEHLCTKLIEREVKAYRSGVYQRDARAPPDTLGYLPAASALRGLMDCLRKQITSPSYEYSDAVLLSILSCLSAEYPRPLPPCSLWWVREALALGAAWRSPALRLAAAQAPRAPDAQALLDEYLEAVEPEKDEDNAMLMFELLPLLCRGMPPNSLRGPLERCLSSSVAEALRSRESPTLVKQLELMKTCLDCDRIHDANRTLLSQILEGYFTTIPFDSGAWPAYVTTCCSLSTAYLERMTSPTSWWEVTGEALRKACSLRAAVGAAADCERPLNWLNEMIDAHAAHLSEQEHSLDCILRALQAAKPDDQSTREWFLQLMARTQVAFKESQDASAHTYLCDVFLLSVVVLSGHLVLEGAGRRPGGAALRALLPAAVAALARRPAWEPHAPQILEWLSHGAADAAGPRGRALAALRHAPRFSEPGVWTRLESYFANMSTTDD